MEAFNYPVIGPNNNQAEILKKILPVIGKSTRIISALTTATLFIFPAVSVWLLPGVWGSQGKSLKNGYEKELIGRRSQADNPTTRALTSGGVVLDGSGRGHSVFGGLHFGASGARSRSEKW